ncbi:D-alanine--D-alanine ligase [uncultured Draconibacterium sp.]|uniref:D-alanine--D-alanine ligase n=1 Tax=uncultured Draconibacterium sp. TaxID=1573823 RepID=UPI0025E0BBE0|nr:D-alanine--D-alanine ligase [uncultured Draconibacterium sp.]
MSKTQLPNIAVIAGGDSSEFVVSVKSGANILKAIDTKKFNRWLVQMQGQQWDVFQDEKKIAEVDKADFSFTCDGKKIKFDFAYITIHGTPGEDGILQGYFELLNIPYSTCNVHSSSLTFNKWFCNNYLRTFGIKMAVSQKFKTGETIHPEAIAGQLGLPLFIKPNAGGSSFGITKVKEVSQIKAAIEKAWQESDEALVEQFIDGHEFTCGAVRLGGKKVIFPITEVIPQNEFFDYEAKYTPGATEEITPARLPEELTAKCKKLTADIYDLCECSGIVRVDFILKNNEFYFLEVNTTPGMTATSFIPQQIAAMGSTLQTIITQIIEDKLA